MDSSLISMTADDAVGLAAIFSILASIIATVAIVGIIWWVLVVIAKWKIFKKAGEKGWKSIIPIYSDYITFKLFWDTKYFWVMLAVSFVSGILSGIVKDVEDPNLFVVLLNLAAAIYLLVLNIQLLHRTSKSFGHGAGFTVGLVFLNNIFLLILGFNGDKYRKISA